MNDHEDISWSGWKLPSLRTQCINSLPTHSKYGGFCHGIYRMHIQEIMQEYYIHIPLWTTNFYPYNSPTIVHSHVKFPFLVITFHLSGAEYSYGCIKQPLFIRLWYIYCGVTFNQTLWAMFLLSKNYHYRAQSIYS